MKYDFDAVIDRYDTNSIKWDFAEKLFRVKDILPMWVADMDFRVAEPIVTALKKTAEHGIFGYSEITDSYYNALIDWMKRRHSWQMEKEWVAFSPGVVPAIHVLVKAFTSPGDQVILQTPAYPPFFNAVKINDREILDNPLRLANGQYVMDLDDLERKIGPRTRMLLLCSPHNPVGRVWQKEELLELGKLCLRHGILIVSDEIHQDIVYAGSQHIPLPLVSKAFADRTVVCTSVSKTFNLAGLQMSNIVISNAELRKRFIHKMEKCGIYSPNSFGIVAAQAAYQYGEPWLEQLLDYLQGNITFLMQYIADRIPGLKAIQPQGTYLVWLDFRDCGIDADRLKDFVRKEAKVGLQAGTVFGCKEVGFERMNIACPRATLAEGLHRIERAVALSKSH
jgi:cystathionine beta-lyase